jgi:hypothetical protein
VFFWDFVGYWFTGVQIRPEEPYTEPEPEGTKLRVTHVRKPSQFIDNAELLQL